MDVGGSGDFGRVVFETIRQAIVVVDDRMRVVVANPAFRDLFQLGGRDLSGTGLGEVVEGFSAGGPLADAVVEAIRTGEPLREMEVQQTLPHLGSRIFVADARRLEAEGGPYAMVALSDLTDQRRAELAREVYAQEVARSNRDLEDFAHAASHDLQEPLRKVRAFADRLVGSFQEAELTDRQRDYLTRMAAAATRMQQRIDDLLGLARVSRTKPAARRVAIDDVVRAVLADLEPRIAESAAVIEVGSLPTLDADPAQLELLFQNLISNSIKYARAPHPPRIVIRSAPVAAPAGDPRGWHEIVVEDNGIGFDPGYAQRIFRPFERLHGRDEFEGSGIGLSVCRRVAEIHGGRIEAEGRPGEGAAFTIRLPDAPLHEEML